MFWAADLGLRTSGLERAERWARGLAPPLPAAGEIDLARMVRWVDVAARHHWLQITCLRRAVVLAAFLERWGLAAELRLGVRREGEGIEAHAWVELDGEAVGETLDPHCTFSPLLPAQTRGHTLPGSSL